MKAKEKEMINELDVSFDQFFYILITAFGLIYIDINTYLIKFESTKDKAKGAVSSLKS